MEGGMLPTAGSYRWLEYPIEMKRGQLLSVRLNLGTDPPSVMVTEMMPPLIPSDRLPDPIPEYEKQLREKEWAEAFSKSLEAR